MKPLTTNDMRVIRLALIHYIADDMDNGLARDLIRTHFSAIPPARIITREVPEQKPIELVAYTGPNVTIHLHADGYLLKARRKHPFKFYAVEWYAEHHLADAARALLESDDAERNRVIREAKAEEHYTKEKPERAKERGPREKFDFSLLTVDTVVEGL